MIAELRARSQITIPKAIADAIGLSVGDKLEVSESDGAIHLVPVAVYPKAYVKRLEDMFSVLDANTANNLREAERARAGGARDYSLAEFKGNMLKAVRRGARTK